MEPPHNKELRTHMDPDDPGPQRFLWEKWVLMTHMGLASSEVISNSTWQCPLEIDAIWEPKKNDGGLEML